MQCFVKFQQSKKKKKYAALTLMMSPSWKLSSSDSVAGKEKRATASIPKRGVHCGNSVTS